MRLYFITPKYIKEARNLYGAAHKVYHYRKDLLSEEKRLQFAAALKRLSASIKSGDKEEVLAAMAEVDSLAGMVVRPQKHAGWREHCEVLLVAIVIAAGVRAYIVQPFKIPTGSMQPTLNGIVAYHSVEPFPNPVIRFLEFFILGRNYIEVISRQDDMVLGLQEKTYLNFFTFTEIVCERERYTVFAPASQLYSDFGVTKGRIYKAGQPIARGVVETGDQVFVDKMSYHFTQPVQGDVFVFKTLGIPGIQNNLPPGVDSQHYIKRLAGMPGQTLQIRPPFLFVNGWIPSQEVFQRVMSQEDGYRGYSNGGAFSQTRYLGSPEATFRVPARSYFALGDNSYNSSDSRNWGPVPARDVAGRGVMVYWPISPRWGFIR